MLLIAFVFLAAVDFSDRSDETVDEELDRAAAELLERAGELGQQADERMRAEGEKALEALRNWREKVERRAGEGETGEAQPADPVGEKASEPWAERLEQTRERIVRNVAWLREKLRETRREIERRLDAL